MSHGMNIEHTHCRRTLCHTRNTTELIKKQTLSYSDTYRHETLREINIKSERNHGRLNSLWDKDVEGMIGVGVWSYG